MKEGMNKGITCLSDIHQHFFIYCINNHCPKGRIIVLGSIIFWKPFGKYQIVSVFMIKEFFFEKITRVSFRYYVVLIFAV